MNELGNIVKMWQILKQPQMYVYLHVQSTGHTFDFSNVNVIAQSSNVKLRRRLELRDTHIQDGQHD